MKEAVVHDNRAELRYEVATGGEIAIAAYRIEADRVVFTHTVVPEAVQGQGVGSRLVRGALADVRARGLSVVPLCSFVAGYIDRHPDEQDLLAG